MTLDELTYELGRYGATEESRKRAVDAYNAELIKENNELREALTNLVNIDLACITYTGKGLADFTADCAYVGRRPMLDVLEIATEAGE